MRVLHAQTGPRGGATDHRKQEKRDHKAGVASATTRARPRKAHATFMAVLTRIGHIQARRKCG